MQWCKLQPTTCYVSTTDDSHVLIWNYTFTTGNSLGLSSLNDIHIITM